MIISFPVFLCSILEWVCGLKPFPAIYKQQFSFTVIRIEFDMRSGADSLSTLTSFQCLIATLNSVLFSWVHIFVLCICRGFPSTLWFCLVTGTPFSMYICMAINTSFYLQRSDPFGTILCKLTGILSPEGKDNSSHGRAELRSHRCLYASVLNCLIFRRDPEPFLQLLCSLKTVTELWQTWNLCFTENLSHWLFEFQIGSVIPNFFFLQFVF